MSVARNIETVRRFYAAGPAADDTNRAEFATPDVVWHVPGAPANPVAGRYAGYDDVFSTIGERMQPLDVWAIDVREVMGNDDLVMSIVELEAARDECRVSCRGGHVFRFAPDGRIAEVWGFVDDQAGLDALFSA